MTEAKVKPAALRVRESESRSIASGSVRMPGGLLPAEAASALSELIGAGYAESKTGAIAKALIAASKRLKK